MQFTTPIHNHRILSFLVQIEMKLENKAANFFYMQSLLFRILEKEVVIAPMKDKMRETHLR